MNEEQLTKTNFETENLTNIEATIQTNHQKETSHSQILKDQFPVFGLSSLIYGIFFCFCIYENFSGITSPILCAATCFYYLFCFKNLHIEADPMRYFFIPCTILLGLSNMLTQNPYIIFMNYCGIILLLFVFLVRHFYVTAGWDFSKYTGALFLSLFCSICHIGAPFVSLQSYVKKSKGNRKITVLSSIFAGLLISIPLLFIIGGLLLSADAVFRNLADYLFADLLSLIRPDKLIGILFTFCFGLCASFGILTELASRRIQPDAEDKRKYEPIVAITFTSILTIIYVIFSGIQVLYLFLGSGKLPQGYSYASYAREGFFQLLFVCLINLVLVLFCMGHYKEHVLLKAILTVICLCTYIMIASSAMRMLLYIGVYHLTFLRVFVLLALLVLALCLGGVLVSIYKNAFPLFTYMLIVVSLCYIAFSLSKPDYYIASYNLATQNAKDSVFDSYYLYNLSTDAVPALAQYHYFDDFSKEEIEKIAKWESFEGNYIDTYEKTSTADVETYEKAYMLYHTLKQYEKQNFRSYNVSVQKAALSLLH